jgi:hypothetical protein
MGKSNWVIAIGAAAAALTMAPLSAGAAPASPELLQPIPNAAPGDAKAIQAQWYYHRHHRWRRYGYYYYGRPYWWHRHHHYYRHYRHWY